jgi:cytosine permease
MPGLLMGLLQFGWLGVNAYFSALALAPLFGGTVIAGKILAVVWALLAAFIGLKGIQYVAKVATFLPLIPLVILIVLFIKTAGGIGSFDAAQFVAAGTPADAPAVGLSAFGVIALSITFVVGFFATAGAAGVDFGTNNIDGKDVQMGGLVGVALTGFFAAGLAVLIAAGAFGLTGEYAVNPADPEFMGRVMGSSGVGATMGLLLAVSAFPSACFASFIAANSFKTTLPKLNPYASVGAGALVSIILAVTGLAGNAAGVFTVIGASFGPICGAMMVDYLLAGKQWPGPRNGWNLAGWISWAVGFVVGILPLFQIVYIPAAPLVAFIVGAVIYFILAKAGIMPAVIPMPAQETQEAAS